MNTDIVFICFNSLGTDDPKRLDFYSLSKHYSVVFVTDKTNSWGNRLDWENCSKIINTIIDGKIAYSIGVSMGGTNSVLSSNYINTKYVVAFNPQFTIYPDIVPNSEYIPYAKKIENWIHKTIEASFSNKQIYYLFVSRHDINDTLFLKRYPNYVFDCGPNYGHNLAFDLKNAGMLDDLLSLLTSDPTTINKFIKNRVRLDKNNDVL
jgi:hypothetical protein